MTQKMNNTTDVIDFGQFEGRILKSLLNTKDGISYVRWMAYQGPPRWRARAKKALRDAGL